MIFTGRRVQVLVGSVIVSLGSGTNYVSRIAKSGVADTTVVTAGIFWYCNKGSGVPRDVNRILSAYAPQLGDALHISHTLVNVVGLAGNSKSTRA